MNNISDEQLTEMLGRSGMIRVRIGLPLEKTLLLDKRVRSLPQPYGRKVRWFASALPSTNEKTP